MCARSSLRGALASLIILVTACSSSTPESSSPEEAFSVDVRIPRPPSVVPVTPAPGRALVFEIEARPRGAEEHRVTEVVVTEEGSTEPLLQLTGETLAASLKHYAFTDGGLAPITDPEKFITAGQAAMAMLLVDLPEGRPVPGRLSTTFTWTDREGDSSDTVHPVDVAPFAPIVVKSPVPPGRWLCDGCLAPSSYHRNAALPVGGQVWVAQRYAIDFELMDEQGRLVEGDITKVENWFGYGLDIIAAADGVVTRARNDVPDSVPPKFPEGMTLEDADGNHALIRTADGVYMLYAHMIPGSVQVKVGDTVRAGDVLGKLGNSGNSLCPHLHFHIVDRDDAIAAEGIPFVLDGFVDHGVAIEKDALNGLWLWTPGERDVVAAQLLPTLNTVFTIQ